MRHTLIPIEALEGLTADELEELELRLRHILQNDPDLTEGERTALVASLENVLKESSHRKGKLALCFS